MTKIQELEEKLKTVSGREKVDLLIELVSELHIFDLRKSESYIRDALDLSEKIEYQRGEANSHFMLGKILSIGGSLNKAEDSFLRALDIFKSLNDIKGISGATVRLGRVFWERGEFSQALDNYLKSIELSENNNDDEGSAQGHSHVALFYWKRGDLEEAIKHLGKVLEYQDRIGNKQDLALTYNRFGVIYKDKGNSSLALENYKKALKLMEESGDLNNIDAAMIYNNMGDLFEDNNDLDSALTYYNKSLQIADTIGYTDAIILSRANMGSINTRLGKFDPAAEQLEIALRLSREAGIRALEIECLNLFSVLFERKNDHERALSYYKEYKELREQLSNEEKDRQIAEMQARFESEQNKKEAEIYRLKNVELKKYQVHLEDLVRERTEELSEALDEVERLKNRLQAENIYLQEEIKLQHNFDEIVSRNIKIRNALMRVEQVASSNSTVLILGETGTGKELIARSIHSISERRDRPLVKVNCAALPANLIESELFGHEKGAFTGAFSRKIGRFELADNSTILLDEIGELPLELQPKLLRVLQEGEFERVGGSRSIKVDVRVIAITNRNLEKAIEGGKFRDDLYYRLNVFPINVPPLRERKDDIPLLVNHFILKICKRVGKKIDKIPQDVMKMLENYGWPGNVRELENVIERSILVSRKDVLELCEWQPQNSLNLAPNRFATLAQMEREYIISTLEMTNWTVRGEKGAAKILGLPPTTLDAKMRKLGIKRPR